MTYPSAPEFRGAQFGDIGLAFRIAILATFFVLAFSLDSRATELKRIDEPAKPDFSLPGLDGTTVPLKAFKGHTVLVHFLATWCAPCREELPALTRFLDRSAAHASVIAISVADIDQRLKRVLEQTPVNFPVLLDRERTVTKSWHVTTLPTTYVLDANMKPLLVVEADFQWDTVDIEPATGKLIKNKIREPETTSDYSHQEKKGSDHDL
ncbi:TlpA disulfide reductase family protein [Tardiphaga sp.]|uniref:TlpA disulfide reductase family protein n=1 Tax=Tardiphaga sp. TaxID=1926292 RepID=UPI00352AB4BC